VPRGPRLDAPGVAHHVMIRGIEKRRIFLSDDDRSDFVERLGRLLPEEMWRCFAWALMPNHVHLVLQGTTGRLSRLMARLNTGYAKGFNQRHRRSDSKRWTRASRSSRTIPPAHKCGCAPGSAIPSRRLRGPTTRIERRPAASVAWTSHADSTCQTGRSQRSCWTSWSVQSESSSEWTPARLPAQPLAA